jgi:GT2 family glycosyltransferase
MHQALLLEQRLRRASRQQRSLKRELAQRSRWASEADQAVRRARKRAAELEQQLEEHAAWARQADAEAAEARKRVEEVEAEIAERTAWAEKADADAEAARERVKEVEAEIKQRTAWAKKADVAAETARQRVKAVEKDIAERTAWAKKADAAAETARQRVKAVEKEIAERTAWAKKADAAAEEARQRVGEVEAEIAERTAWAKKADAAAEAARKRVKAVEKEIAERTAWAKKADQTAEEARQRVAELEALVEERTAWAQSLDAELEDRRAELAEVGQDLVETRAELVLVRDSLNQSQANYEELERLQQETAAKLDTILASHSWRMTRPLRVARRILKSMRDARAYNPLRWPLLLSKLVRYLTTVGVKGTIQRLNAPGQSDTEAATASIAPPVRRPRGALAGPGPTETPQVSIVIPAYNQWAYTRQCLESIAAARDAAAFEVIVVNDASGDETREELDRYDGITALHNEENLGFIRSCNLGLEHARGEFVVILNNDTEVRDGWLDAMLETFDRVPEAGLVGAKLIYPDGSLQECGGLILRDGSGWNYGRNDDPERPEYQFLRETDYCSGACFMLRTATFRELGGFDTHYAPAYYEDTDLAFRVRALGQKVLVQPAAVVVHHEGITSGTDIESGTKRYQEINREKFLERWAKAIQLQPPRIDDPDDAAVVRRSRDHRLRGRVLVIDATTPEPDQDSGSVRLTNLMQCFQDLGYGVTFFADNRVHAGRYTRQLQQAGVEALYLPWLDSLNGFFEQRGADFDYVFISRHYIAVNYLSLLKKYCPDAPFIFDTVDLHYLREQRLAELEDSTSLRQVARQTRRSELGIVAAADATVVVSPAEVEVLARDAPGAMVHVLSNIHEVPGCRAGFNERQDLFFVGGYQHPPNIDAAKWFVGEIWPRVHEKLPDARFHLIGSKATEEVSSLDGNGVVFHGFVEDLEHYLDHCRLAVAPLRYGAGVKGKVNMSMSYGQPVVATPVAVEGMYAEDGREVLVAETPEEFAEQVIRLYQDEALWSRVSDAAIENVRAHFSLDAARRSLASLLEALR